MSKLGSKEEILSAIQSHFENIQSGKLTADELESLVELTRELHERALILRYKAYEEKIFGARPEKAEQEPEAKVEIEEEKEIFQPEEPEAEEVSTQQHAIGFEEIEAEILAAESTQAEEPVFDFDMFEKAEADIFSPLATEKEEIKEEVKEEKIEFPVSESKQIAEEIEESPVTVSQQMPVSASIEVEKDIESKSETEEIRPAQAEEKEKEIVETKAVIEPVQEKTEPSIPLPEKLALMNEPVIPEQTQKQDTDMFKKISNTNDSSLSSRLMSTKLTTLVGAFGLNDKLQCIRELFKGSSEAFNQAIETLDQQENFAAAKRVLAQYAQQNSWDLESNLTAEFIQKVERRFL